jgi:hypothetical protein
LTASRKAYLYVKGNNIQDVISMLEAYESLFISKLDSGFLEISFDNDLDLETFRSAREFSMVELFQDFTVFICPSHFSFKISDILNVLPDINPGIYFIEDFIPEIVLLNKTDLITKLRSYYYNRFSPETIETIIGFINQNMNASKTAKVLYMHRNTLNYRLDNFINRTEIDVRKFKGALAMYLLFKV